MMRQQKELSRIIGDTLPVSARFALIALLAALYLFNAFELRLWLESEIPTGPDQQCYFRQAQLFHEKGLIGGLDTESDFDGTRYLIAKAKAANPAGNPDPEWENAITPECHRYKRVTDKVISQYPPGTGFLLALFPEGKQVRMLYLVIETIIFGWFAYLLWFAPNSGAALLLGAFGCFAVIQLNYEGYMSFSLAPSMLACMLMAYCTVQFLACEDARRRALFAAICGALLGLSVSLRTANILLAGGYMLVFADMCLRKRQWKMFPAALAFGAALLVALVPSLAANAINAGSPFATTYGGGDAAQPVLTWKQISDAIDYHFFGEGIGYVFDAGMATTVVFEIGRRLLRLKTVPYLSFINTATWTIAAAYYLTHSILNSYYLIPTALFSMSLIVFGLCAGMQSPSRRTADESFGRLAAACAVSVLGILTIAAWGLTLGDGPKPGEPLPALEKNAIVWADPSGGLFSYYLKQSTALLDRVSPALQTRIMTAVAQDGRPQYLIADCDLMKALIARTAGAVRAGNMFGYEAYRLEPHTVAIR